jgi:hypothetical protein
VDRFVRSGISGIPPTPFNQFGHATKLAGPEASFHQQRHRVLHRSNRPERGPLRLDVPATDGRYYALQFVDAWTNNFAYVGHRSTGTDAGSFLLVPPGEDGPHGELPVIHFPTTVASIVGRWAVDGEADLPAVTQLQDLVTLTPLADQPCRGLPEAASSVAPEIEFYEHLRTYMQALAPAERDRATRAGLESLGLLERESPYVDPDPGLLAAFR